MHRSTARRRRIEPSYEPDADDYPRQKRSVVRRRSVAPHAEDLPERFVCPTFLSGAMPANDLRQAGPPMGAVRKQRVAHVHPTADIPPFLRGQPRMGSRERSAPGGRACLILPGDFRGCDLSHLGPCIRNGLADADIEVRQRPDACITLNCSRLRCNTDSVAAGMSA